jgi:homoserine dehydrogenase
MTQKTPLHIGLFGFGCVGQGLYEVIEKTPDLHAHIHRICVKSKNKNRSIDASHFTCDKWEILDDPNINIVVELIDDADAAFDIVCAALQRGKAVVTANKKMLAEHFETLKALQIKHQVPLLYEASVCASIPIIRNLEEYYDNDLLDKITGIVNGSTNYILSKIFSENIDYNIALQEAQEKGYAETNPILDTGGFDAKYKLLILLAHAFGTVVKPDDIFNIGIQNLGTLELNYAREKGYKIKLIAQAFKNGDQGISAFVAPFFVTADEKLYQVDDVYNGVQLETAFTEKQFFQGKGAGAYPTASAVLSDISALAYNYKYEYKKIGQKPMEKLNNQVRAVAMLRANAEDIAAYRSHFTAVHEVYQNNQEAYIIGEITLEQLKLLSQITGLSLVINRILN